MKQLTKESFYISKYTNTSYKDVLEMSALERKYLLEFIVEDFKRQKEVREAFEASIDANRRGW